MKKILALVLALCMVFALCACGQQAAPAATEDKVVFKHGIDPEFNPFSYMGDDGEYTGFDVEGCKAACELLGWEYEPYAVNWDLKLEQLDANECDCIWSGMTLLDSMAEAGYVLSNPYYDNTQVIVVKADSGITSAADLAGKVVAVQLGTSGETMLNGDEAALKDTFAELVTCDSFLKCFTELDGGAVDAVFVDQPVANKQLEKNSNFVVLDEGFGAEQYGIAFRSGAQALCDAIAGAVATLVENGTYAEIAAQFGLENSLMFLN